ncbi:hypothetical protein FVEG_15628 [Fusarium verticillioides 7600]|uniref:Uncharacterized protein n=1 Tax=Gibberella moniliformis (strain M3125 / FGSC 7600) TaxID=334819 RepID=W7M9Z9_GIBM7|nr:hypothetical protein FVEG_15628 [Fusarium verticillioides 7600]EWG44259.1 hypothetical protein FVEG_15628 [Fusarium verticillioides 7600]
MATGGESRNNDGRETGGNPSCISLNSSAGPVWPGQTLPVEMEEEFSGSMSTKCDSKGDVPGRVRVLIVRFSCWESSAVKSPLPWTILG